MREIRTYGLKRGPPHRQHLGGVLYSTQEIDSPSAEALSYKQVSRSASEPLPLSLVIVKIPCGQRVILREAEKKRRSRFAARKAWRGIEGHNRRASGARDSSEPMRGSRRKTAKSVLRVVEDRAGVPCGGVPLYSTPFLTPVVFFHQPRHFRSPLRAVLYPKIGNTAQMQLRYTLPTVTRYLPVAMSYGPRTPRFCNASQIIDAVDSRRVVKSPCS